MAVNHCKRWSSRAKLWSHHANLPDNLPMPEALTTITTWAAALASGLQRRGIDPSPLFEEAGLDIHQLSITDARYPVSGMTRLWRLAARASQCEAIGLEIAAELQPGALHALGSAIVASNSLADAFGRLDRYSRLVSNAGRWLVIEQEEWVELQLQVVEQGQAVSDEAVDAFLGSMVRLGQLMTQGRFAPHSVCLRRQRPNNSQAYSNFFGCEVGFNAANNGMKVDAATWHARLPGANEAVAQAVDSLAGDYLAKLDKHRIAWQTRNEILRCLPSGEPSLAEVAKQLHCSVRSLQRKLAAEGLSFKSLVESTRYELAQAYLRNSAHSLTEIAFLLGFSDQSNFNRAFRRWANVSPGVYREQHAQPSAAP